MFVERNARKRNTTTLRVPTKLFEKGGRNMLESGKIQGKGGGEREREYRGGK